MESRINYLALLIVIIVGVCAGNLVSNWITAKYIETEVGKATAEISKVLTTKSKNTQQTGKKKTQQIIAEDTISQEQLFKQRKLDDDGIRLAKNCSEWTVANKDMQTQTSERGMHKHCELYHEYIRSGSLPDSN